jgi:hypothetical protein
MKYVAYSTPKPLAKLIMGIIGLFKKIDPTELTPLLKDEIQTGWDLTKKGIIRELYWRKDEMGSVVILECASQEEAEAALKTLPYAQKGYITFKVIPVGYFEPYEAVYKLLQPK